MEIKEIKKKLVIRSSILVFITIVASVVSIYLNDSERKSNEKLNWLKNDISSLNSKLDGLNKKTLEFSAAVKIWENFSDGQRLLQGLRINEAKDILDAFKEPYKLSEMKVSFSKPHDVKDAYITDTVGVVASNINIDFKALTDYHALNFLAALTEEFPGYVQITSFSLMRSKEVSKETLEKIANGDVPGMVEGKVSLDWKDLKYKGPVAVKKEEEGGVGQ